jgi:hypothetical protein
MRGGRFFLCGSANFIPMQVMRKRMLALSSTETHCPKLHFCCETHAKFAAFTTTTTMTSAEYTTARTATACRVKGLRLREKENIEVNVYTSECIYL